MNILHKQRFNLKTLTLAVATATTVLGGAAVFAQSGASGNLSGNAISSSAVKSGENRVQSTSQARADVRGEARLDHGSVVGSARQNTRTVAKAGIQAAADTTTEAEESADDYRSLVGEAAGAVQVHGDTENVLNATSAVKANDDNVSVDAGVLSESNVGLDVNVGEGRETAHDAIDESSRFTGEVKSNVAGLARTTVNAGTELAGDITASADVDGDVDAGIESRNEFDQELGSDAESEVDGAIVETSDTLRAGLDSAFETEAEASAGIESSVESSTDVDAGIETGVADIDGSAAGETAADTMAEVSGDSGFTGDLATTLDGGIEEATEEATEATDVMSETSELDSDVAADVSSETSSGLDAGIDEVTGEFSNTDSLDLTGNL